MADVRALLRAENAARRGPASSSSSQKHNNSKKRKAAEDSSNYEIVERKKSRPAEVTSSAPDVGGLPAGFFDGTAPESIVDDQEEGKEAEQESLQDTAASHKDDRTTTVKDQSSTNLPKDFFDQTPSSIPAKHSSSHTHSTQPPTLPTINEDEYAAFEQEIASLPTADENASNAAAYSSTATISAPALTAAEVAARSQEQKMMEQREVKDRELEDRDEGEEEDAKRRTEEEFELMEGYEDRVKRLRAKMEALREKGKSGVGTEADDNGEKQVTQNEEVKGQDEESELDSDDDDEEWNGWRFS